MRQLIFLSPLILLSSCYAPSIMQTAKPAAPGELETTVAASFYALDGDPMGSASVMLRTGVTKRSDLGLSYCLGLYGHGRVDYKYNIWKSKNENAFLSTGLGFDIISREGHNDAILFPGITLPTYFSWNHNKKATYYCGSRLTFGLEDIGVIQSIYGDKSLEHHWFISGGFGVKWGDKRIKWFAELAIAVDNENIYYPAAEDYLMNNRQYRSAGLIQVSTGFTLGKKQDQKKH